MAKKILKALTNNFGFKMLAVVFAFMLWLVVYNIEDPVITRPYTAVVSVKNEDKITDMNKCYEILDASNIVSFSVSAKRSVMDKLEDSDFTAVADMNNIIMNEDKTSAEVRIDISSGRYSRSIKYNGKKQYLKIALENLLSKQFVITPSTDGAVAEGYALGNVSVTNPNVLKVSGPESIVGQIASIVATIDVDGMTMDLSDNVVPVLYDADGKEIPTTNLKLSNSTVQIAAQILGTKQILVKSSTVGVPAGENRILDVVCKPSKVMVKGTASALNQITSIEIPASVIDVSGITDNLETTIDITEFLPDNVELVNATDANISVIVKIETYDSRNYTIRTSNLDVEGLSEDCELTFNSQNLIVTVAGASDNISKLFAKDIEGTINVSDLEPGTHVVKVQLALDENRYTWTELETTVVISKKENGIENTDSEKETDGTVDEDDHAGADEDVENENENEDE